jgi:hypothetical protein
MCVCGELRIDDTSGAAVFQVCLRDGATDCLFRDENLMPTMPQPCRALLVESFGRLIQAHRALAEPLELL